MSKILTLKVQLIDVQDGEEEIVVLNENDAREYWINAFDKVEITYLDSKFVVNADLSKHYIKQWFVGIFDEVAQKYNLKDWDIVSVHFTQRDSLTVDAIRKKMRWESLNYDEIYSIIKDISDNKLTDILITYYVASSFFKDTSDEETYLTAKAMADTWITFKYPKWEIIADKHCIWGVPWNETSMIIIPIIASLGIKIPKNFSKAITSPAATWECVSVLMNINFDKEWINKLVSDNNSCLVWWWWLDLAPADDRIIKVSYPLSMQNISKVVSSIMAKKYAMWVSHSLIDIPVWPTAKVKSMDEAKVWKDKFEKVWVWLGMKMSVEITQAEQPIWAGIWWVLQVREVLRVLQQNNNRPLDLEEKAIYLASKIIENVWLAEWESAYKLAYWQLLSWKAREMMQKMIKAQAYPDWKSEYFEWWNAWNVESDKLKLAKYSKDIIADTAWVINNIDMKKLNMVVRCLWAPYDLQAWIFLNKKLNYEVEKWDILYTLYANTEQKIKNSEKLLEESNFIFVK